MKFSQVVKGTRAERPVEMPGLAGPDGKPVSFLVRPLTGTEVSDVIAGAVEHARGKGATDPQPGDELYEIGRMAHTLAIACLDPDSPPAGRAPFFDAGPAQILGDLGMDTIAILYEKQRAWQDECSPYRHELTDGELRRMVSEVAGPGGDENFLQLSPHMRLVFARSSAVLLASLLAPRPISISTSSAEASAPPSDPTTTTTTSTGDA